MSLKEYIFLNLSTHTLQLKEPFGIDMEHPCPLFNEISQKQNPEDPQGWKKIPEESEDPQIVNPGVSKVEISRGTPGFGVLKEPLAIPDVNNFMKNNLAFLLDETSVRIKPLLLYQDSF